MQSSPISQVARAVMLLFGCGLVGCADYYQASGPVSQRATVRGTYRRSGITWERYNLSLDGKAVRMSDKEPLSVDPGPHMIDLAHISLGSTADVFFGGLKSAVATTPFTFQPGTAYLVDGEQQGNLVKMWLEFDGTGKRASPVFFAQKQRVQNHSTPVFIPIPAS